MGTENFFSDIAKEFEKYNCDDLVEWIVKNRIKHDGGGYINFEDYPFLKDPYNDWTQRQIIPKAAQIGWSVMANIKAIWAAKVLGYNVIYCLPSDDHVKAFVKTKTNMLIENNDIFKSWLTGSESIQAKKFGKKFVLFRGTFTTTDAISLTSDLNIFDEHDRSDKDVTEVYASRLGSSDYQGEWYFSNPLAPNMGVSERYENSDKKEWFVKCSHCNVWQTLEFPESIDKIKEIFICKKCKKEISDDDRRRGRWEATADNPDNAYYSGYHVSRLISPRVSATKILYDSVAKDKQYFRNFVLGLPYAGSDDKLDRSTILAAISDRTNSMTDNVIGVDVGNDLYYVIGNWEGIFKVGILSGPDRWEKLEEFKKMFDATMVIDAMPDTTKPEELRKKYPSRIFVCYYKPPQKGLEQIRWGKKDKFGVVYADRTWSIDNLINRIITREITFTLPRKELEEPKFNNQSYIKHCENIYKMEKINALGDPEKYWDNQGHDHMLHATNYFSIGLEKVRKKEVRDDYKDDTLPDKYSLEHVLTGTRDDDWYNL